MAFKNALAAYHSNRYLNGGRPIVADAAAAGGGGGAKIADLRDLGAEIRNTVRTSYRSGYGTDPTDSEVTSLSDSLIKVGNDLQRKFLRKYGDPNTEAAQAEATERVTERLEHTPEAEFLNESEEENTRLRDTLERMASMTSSLVN